MKKYIYILLTFPLFLFSQDLKYIEIIKPDINIRMKATTSSPIIAHAFQGEVYITDGETDKWCSVVLASGESRWIYKKLVKKIDFDNLLSKKINIEKTQNALKGALVQAKIDAEKESIKDLNKQEIENILIDRYCLIALQEYSINPAHHNAIMHYVPPPVSQLTNPVEEYLVSVSHVDYDLFKVDFENIYIETKRSFKIGSALDAMIFIYSEDDQFIKQLCFERSYGKGFENCYDIKNIYSAVLSEPDLVVLTQDGKIKKTNLVLKETTLKLAK